VVANIFALACWLFIFALMVDTWRVVGPPPLGYVPVLLIIFAFMVWVTFKIFS
jgi:hypothetical protein